MSINPGQAVNLGQTPEPTNPLLMLTKALVEQNEILALIAANTAKEERHLYAVQDVGGDGSFMSSSLACSEDQQRSIFPCAAGDRAPLTAPPATFQVTQAPRPSARPDILSGD